MRANRQHIYIEEDYHQTYRELVDSRSAPFRTMKDIFLMAAVLGLRHGSPVELKHRKEIFQWTILNPQEDLPILQAVAIAQEGPDVLADLDRIIDVAERLANSGILYLRELAVERPGTATENLLEYILGDT